LHDQDHVEAKQDENIYEKKTKNTFTCLVGISLYLSSPSGGTPISF
jgi:hypothetical protein